MQKEFKTRNMALITTLSLNGIHAIRLDKDSKIHGIITFVFEETEELKKFVEDFFQEKTTVEPTAFFNQVKVIKSRISSEVYL